MAASRRPRAATAEKRARILDAAEQIMLRDGYAAVTSRRVEAEAGLKLHYHFGTVDELFVAVFRRRAERNVERMASALGSPTPLRAWWGLASDPRGTALLVELTAAANHRAALQAEVAKLARDVRRMQIETLEAILDDYGIDRDRVSAGARRRRRAGPGARRRGGSGAWVRHGARGRRRGDGTVRRPSRGAPGGPPDALTARRPES